MNLTIDFGNSRIKVGVFDERKLIHLKAYESLNQKELKSILSEYDIKTSIISSVVGSTKAIEKLLSTKTRFYKLPVNVALPFKNRYKTPETLGTDRIANLAGAQLLFPDNNLLVISAGTCITYDVITENAVYNGGNITAGLEMKFKAMNTFTARLPLVKKEMTYNLFGKTTAESILTGVIKGTSIEMKGFIDLYKRKYNGLKIILTGGDAPFFERTLNCKIFAIPNLTLHGLNNLLLINE